MQKSQEMGWRLEVQKKERRRNEYLGIGRADRLALFRKHTGTGQHGASLPTNDPVDRSASVASGFPRRRSAGTPSRSFAAGDGPLLGFSAQALKSEIRVALRRRHADASHHALPSTGHSPRQA